MAAEVKLGREALATLQSEHAAKLNVWVRERQVAAVHAWACALGVELRLRAFTSVEAFIAAAECDPLQGDSTALYKAMQNAGRSATLKIYPGVLHSFIHYSRLLDQATEALRDGADARKAARD